MDWKKEKIESCIFTDLISSYSMDRNIYFTSKIRSHTYTSLEIILFHGGVTIKLNRKHDKFCNEWKFVNNGTYEHKWSIIWYEKVKGSWKVSKFVDMPKYDKPLKYKSFGKCFYVSNFLWLSLLIILVTKKASLRLVCQ